MYSWVPKIGGSISRTRAVSSIESKIREFLSDKSRVAPFVSSTLVGIHKWLIAVQTNGSGPIAAKRNWRSRADLIEEIAEGLIEGETGIERKLLSKSLQETLFCCLGFRTDLDYSQFRTQFIRYLERQGASSFIQRFLSLYFFNFVWLHTGESFRTLARNSDSFSKDMERVEYVCQKAVAANWKLFEQTHRLLDSSSARELICNIEQRLRLR